MGGIQGGSPADDGDQDIIPVVFSFFKGRNLLIQSQWDATPPLSHAPTK